ncbi:reverse transcriptase domain-containing protein [Tanacetum coccineum]
MRAQQKDPFLFLQNTPKAAHGLIGTYGVGTHREKQKKDRKKGEQIAKFYKELSSTTPALEALEKDHTSVHSAVSYQEAPKDPFLSSKHSKAAQIKGTYGGRKKQKRHSKKLICGVLANAHNTNARRGSDNVPHSFDIEHKLSFIRNKRRRTAAISNGSGAELMLIDPKGKEYTYALQFGFETTNNEAEYESLLVGLRIAQEMEIKTKEALKGFNSYKIEHIRRNQNKKADALRKLASMTFEHLTKEVLVEVLAKRSIEEKEILQVETKEEESWTTLIHEYLVSGLLPEDPKESRKVRVKAPQYKMIRGSLYRRAMLNGGQNYEARILLAVNAQRHRKGSPASQLVHLKLVLESLRKEKLYAKVSKLGDALSRNERVKSRRVRGMILAAQSVAFKQENVLAERLHGLDQQMERKGDESLYFMDRSLRYLSENEIESPWILSLNFQGQSSEYDVIWVMVDRLTKLAHFLAIQEDFKM